MSDLARWVQKELSTVLDPAGLINNVTRLNLGLGMFFSELIFEVSLPFCLLFPKQMCLHSHANAPLGAPYPFLSHNLVHHHQKGCDYLFSAI